MYIGRYVLLLVLDRLLFGFVRRCLASMDFLGCQLAPVLIRETFLLIPLDVRQKTSLYPKPLPSLQWFRRNKWSLELRGAKKKNLGESSVMN